MSDELRAHYTGLFRTHGDSARAVQYSDEASQLRRFEVLTAVHDDLGSVLDVGAGLGHLLTFLRSRGFAGTYCGVDFVEAFIDHASAKFANDSLATFQLADLRTDPLPTGCDYAIVNGVFNNLMDDNRDFLETTITRMFEAAGRGIAFNAMSTYVDYRDENLFYVDPLEVFDFCKTRLSRRVVLRHDYLTRPDSVPFEFTMYVYK